MNPQLQGSSPSLQGGSLSGGVSIQGSSPQLQASNNSGLQVQNAPTTSANILQPAGQSEVASNQAAINSAQSQANSTTNAVQSLLKEIQAEEQANVPGTAATLNLNAINAAAQNSAQNTVNPLYSQYLNQYLQEMAANQQAAQAQNTLNIQGEQSALGNTLAQNQLAEQAAASGNTLTQGNINVQQQNYQLQTGQAQNAKLAAIGQSIGSGNLGASGLGQQQLYNAENSRNIADAAQLGQFQYERNTSNLSTQDTFAQLAQSSQYATTAEGEQEAQTNFNLNDYLRQAAYNDSQYQEQLSASQQQAITAQTAQNEAQSIQSAIAAYAPTGSKNYAASESAYGALLSPSESLPSAPSQSDYLNAYGTSV